MARPIDLPDGFVEMKHPEVEGIATARRDAFDEVWAPKGWVLVEEASSSGSTTRKPVTDIPKE